MSPDAPSSRSDVYTRGSASSSRTSSISTSTSSLAPSVASSATSPSPNSPRRCDSSDPLSPSLESPCSPKRLSPILAAFLASPAKQKRERGSRTRALVDQLRRDNPTRSCGRFLLDLEIEKVLGPSMPYQSGGSPLSCELLRPSLSTRDSFATLVPGKMRAEMSMPVHDFRSGVSLGATISATSVNGRV